MSKPERYHRHRFSIEVVEQCVWLYYRFALSYRDVEEMMAKRGVQLTYETVRKWCEKFGPLYAAQLRKKRAKFGSKWHLDEVFIKMNGVQHYLWRAVDQNGVTIDILVQPRRDRWAALRFFRKLLDVTERAPRVVITDKLRSYAAAKRRILPEVEYRQSRYLNNHTENSHQPTRVRERQMKRFHSSQHAQRFLSIFESINAAFRARRHLFSATYASISSLAYDCLRDRRSIVSHLRQCLLLALFSSHCGVKLTMPGIGIPGNALNIHGEPFALRPQAQRSSDINEWKRQKPSASTTLP